MGLGHKALVLYNQQRIITQGGRIMSHDTGYKELFSHPEFVEALLDGFVPQDISGQLDYSTLNSHPGNYITPLFEEKIEDAVWSLQFKADSGTKRARRLYLYILLEFQSKNAAAHAALQRGFLPPVAQGRPV